MLASVKLYHIPLESTHTKSSWHPGSDHRFWIRTCQRLIGLELEAEPSPKLPIGAQVFTGREAYAFLLEFGSGLQSRVLGEADVLGQLKSAWKTSSCRSSIWHSLMQACFEDIKLIRQSCLQDLGNQSYGNCLRQWMQRLNRPLESVLLLGAGQLAETIAPSLSQMSLEEGFALQVWNRDLQKAHEISKKMSHFKVSKSLKQGLEESKIVVACIPADASSFLESINWCKHRLIHLGGYGFEFPQDLRSKFDALESFFPEGSDEKRNFILKGARSLIWERAWLRSLDYDCKVHAQHGWEDLECFWQNLSFPSAQLMSHDIALKKCLI